MNTQSGETLREKALRLDEEYQKDRAEEAEQQKMTKSQQQRADLEEAIKRVFGDGVTYTIIQTDNKLPRAIVDGFQELIFGLNKELGIWVLVARPNITVPEGEEYEEWYNNPANSELLQYCEVHELHEVGELLRRWANLDRTVKPWTQQIMDRMPTLPDRFAQLSIEDANAEILVRPFKVLGVMTDSEDIPYLIVEYTDITAETITS